MRVLHLLLLALSFVPGMGLAAEKPAADREVSWAEQQGVRCMDAVGVAERRHGVLPGLLAAIGKTESGRPVPPLKGLQPWPWAVNADGAALYFDSKAAAVAWVEGALARGVRQIDVGCMQINLQAHPAAFASVDAAFEPAANADYAARFLTRLHGDAGGNWFDAVGWYHSRTPARAADYRERVSAIAQGKIPALSLGMPLYVRAIQQGSLRIALVNGGVLRINVNRQPAAKGRKRMSACEVARVLGDYMAAGARARCGGVRHRTMAGEAGASG